MNPLADFIKRFDPYTISQKDADFISEGVKEIIEDYLVSRKLPISRRDEVISYTPFVGGEPKQIFLKPDNSLSGLAINTYAETMRLKSLESSK